MTWRSFVYIVLVAAYCVARAKPCMLCFVMRRPACWSWFFELYCTCQKIVAFVNDCNKEHYYYYYYYYCKGLRTIIVWS